VSGVGNAAQEVCDDWQSVIWYTDISITRNIWVNCFQLSVYPKHLLFSNFTRLSYNYHDHMHMWCIWSVCMSGCLKTIADICFLLGSYEVWRKILDDFAHRVHRSRTISILEGSSSLGKVESYSVAGSEIPSLIASFSRLRIVTDNHTMSQCVDTHQPPNEGKQSIHEYHYSD